MELRQINIPHRACRLLLSFWVLALLIACTVPLYEPVGLGLPPSISTQQTMSAIASGIRLGGWKLVSSHNLGYVAQLSNYDEEARVRIDYDPGLRIVSFRYLDSKNMQYAEGSYGKEISFSYNIKLEEMEKAVAIKLAELITAKSLAH